MAKGLAFAYRRTSEFFRFFGNSAEYSVWMALILVAAAQLAALMAAALGVSLIAGKLLFPVEGNLGIAVIVVAGTLITSINYYLLHVKRIQDGYEASFSELSRTALVLGSLLVAALVIVSFAASLWLASEAGQLFRP